MAAHVLFIPLGETVCVSVHSIRMCVCVIVPVCFRVCTVCVLEPPRVGAHISVRLHTALSAATHVVSHFELLLSDSYRLDVCVVAEASKEHLALCIPLEKVTLVYPH